MSGAKKTFDKITSKSTLSKRFNPFPTKKKDLEQSYLTNPIKAVPDSVEDLGEVFTPEIPVPEEETIIPIPDERSSELEAKKRRARSRSSGRSSTILTDRLGG